MAEEIKPGDSLTHYRIVAKIGEGGMGDVYLAEDERLHRKLALKVLPAEVASNKDRMRRFNQEASSAAALNRCIDSRRCSRFCVATQSASERPCR